MIDAKTVRHIADLSKLKLTAEEAKKMAGDLAGVIGLIDELDKVDTDGIEPTAQVSGLVNRTRADIATDWQIEERALALEQAETANGLVKVNKIL